MPIANFDYPGVKVTEATRGAIPIDQVGFRTMFIVGITKRGPLVPTLVTKPKQFEDIFGGRYDASYVDDAVRAIFENVEDVPIYIQRVIGAAPVIATRNLVVGGTRQVETSTIVVPTTITTGGTIIVTVTAAGLTGSPVTVNVDVVVGDTSATVADKIRIALAAHAVVGTFFSISGTNSDAIATARIPAANDATMNLALAVGTAVGLTAAPTSANTTPGTAGAPVITINALGPGADYNFTASPGKGISITLVGNTLTIYDGGVAKEVYYDVVFTNYAAKVQEINGFSNLIQIVWTDTTQNPDAYAIAAGLQTGTDGAAVTASTYIGSESASPKTGIYAFTNPDLPNGFLMCPGQSGQAVGIALIDVAERFRKLALIDSTFGLTTAQALAERNLFASSMGYAMYIYLWAKTRDIDTDADKWVPRSPYRAAHIARSHFQPNSIANVGAGLDYRLRGVLALERKLDNTTQGELNRNGVDCARDFTADGQGLVSWAARTISTNPLFKFVQVRVILNVLASSLEKGLKPYVFRVIDGQGVLAREIQASAEQLCFNLYREGVLFGTNPEDAYLVVVDFLNRSQIEAGILGVDVYVKPSPVAERINVVLYRVPLNFDFKARAVIVGNVEAA